MPDFRVSGHGDRGVIHLEGGDLGVSLRWPDDGVPEFSVDEDAPRELLDEFYAAIGYTPQGEGS